MSKGTTFQPDTFSDFEDDLEYCVKLRSTESSKLLSIVYKRINKRFGYGKYDTYKVIMMLKNSYINVTNLCAKFNKTYEEWLEEADNVDEFFKAVSKKTGKKVHELIKLVKSKSHPEINGLYIDCTFILTILSWLSMSFRIKSLNIAHKELIAQAHDSNSDSNE
jgi:hypothetical protein